MALNNRQIEDAELRAKAYKLFDERGLYILVKPNGSKLFRMKYRFDGKEYSLSFGRFGDITLGEAQKMASDARNQLAYGTNPNETKKVFRRMTKVRIRHEAENLLLSPLKILRNHLEHLDAQVEHMQSKKRDIENQLDYVQWDLNETLGFMEQIKQSLKYLEKATKE
jgi:uncharacterized protein YifE (UPF0438 family)